MADLACENEYLVPDSELENHDKQGDYLYIAILDSTSESGNVMENKINRIRTVVINKTKQMEAAFKDN